jgi:hypothetical protein
MGGVADLYIGCILRQPSMQRRRLRARGLPSELQVPECHTRSPHISCFATGNFAGLKIGFNMCLSENAERHSNLEGRTSCPVTGIADGQNSSIIGEQSFPDHGTQSETSNCRAKNAYQNEAANLRILAPTLGLRLSVTQFTVKSIPSSTRAFDIWHRSGVRPARESWWLL